MFLDPEGSAETAVWEQTYVLHTRRVLAAAGLLVVFGGDVLPLPGEAFPGRSLGLRWWITHTNKHIKEPTNKLNKRSLIT